VHDADDVWPGYAIGVRGRIQRVLDGISLSVCQSGG